jgi:hypothetical protein
MDLNKELLHLKKLMEEGRITLLKSMAEPLRNVKQNPDGTVVEDSVSGSIRALLLAIRAAEDNRIEFGEINEDFLEKIKSMSKEEREKYFLNLPREKAAGYKEIFMRVMQLEDFYMILSDLPKEKFRSEFNLGIIELDGNPADSLKDYIILEIRKFYELAYKEELVERLPPPEYWTKLRDFRDARIAHPSKGCDFKLNEDIEKLYGVIDEIGLDKIVEDFKKYAKRCIEHVSELDN